MTDNLINRATIDLLLTSVGGDKEFLVDLSEDFFEDTLDQIANLRNAYDADDATSFTRTAHTLKTNSASFGATGLAELCKKLESYGKAGNLAGADAKVNEVEMVFGQVKIALEGIISGL